jgi:pyruvate dehydrogenase E2 component (dihydrolipoamide acetyltransferase)
MSTAQASEVVMPRLSDSMEEGTIVRWLKQHGDAVQPGDPIVEIETDKATMEYEVESAGTLEVVAAEGSTLPLGAVIARLLPEGAEAPPPPSEAEPSAAPPEAPAAAAPVETVRVAAGAVDGNGGGPRTRATPIARRLAREHGIDLAGVTATGRRGQVTKADVDLVITAGSSPAVPAGAPAAPAPAPAAAPPDGDSGEPRVETLSRTQQVVARRMSESRATVPDLSVEVDVDMDACLDLRAQLKAVADPAPSVNDLVVKACAQALREHPRVNGSYRDGRFELHDHVNVGVAVAAEDALLVPVVKDADRKGLGEIAATTRALASRVRDGSITPPELSGGTVTVSNLGMFGITRFDAVINTPQAAILAVGAVERRPVAKEDRVEIGQRMSITMACDHRIVYGADAARYLAHVRDLLENPLQLML